MELKFSSGGLIKYFFPSLFNRCAIETKDPKKNYIIAVQMDLLKFKYNSNSS